MPGWLESKLVEKPKDRFSHDKLNYQVSIIEQNILRLLQLPFVWLFEIFLYQHSVLNCPLLPFIEQKTNHTKCQLFKIRQCFSACFDKSYAGAIIAIVHTQTNHLLLQL